MMTSEQPVTLDAPLAGEWAIWNPPGHPKKAFDFLATRKSRLPYPPSVFLRHLLSAIPLSATYAWKQPVFAPADGQVIAVCDGIPDREPINMVRDLFTLLFFPPQAESPFSAYGGNHVILKCGWVFPLLAHLRCGSLCVKEGDYVSAGDQLAEVGNSGASLQPHLHFQVMSSASPFPLFENLVAFQFRMARKRVGSDWRLLVDVEPHNGDHLFFTPENRATRSVAPQAE